MADMIGAFRLNGIASQDFDLISRSVKRPILPPAKTKRIELPNASGAYDFDDLEYGIRSITMRIMYIGKDYYELRTRARSIAAWLSNPSWVKLIMDDEQDLYYLAKITEELDLNNFWESGAIDVVFDCQPFAYSVQEKNIPGTSFVNPGTRKIDYKSPQGSKFRIMATGSNITIIMNGKTMTYSGANGVLIIDSINMEATLNGENVFGRLSGDIDSFFTVLPGQNTFYISGGSNVSINYIPMWI